MKVKHVVAIAVSIVSLGAPVALIHAQEKKPAVVVQIPDPGVPQVMTLEAKFVRAAYNREGYVIMGYQPSQRSVGEDWMLLEMGTTVLDGVPEYTLKRSAISLELPDGKTIPLPTVEEHRAGDTRPIQARSRVQRDSINYFPVMASQPCRIGFFSDLEQKAMPYEEVSVTNRRACLGRLYFKIPGGIKYGQYWLNVKFEKSLIRVPFKIFTKEEEQLLSKNYKSIEQQVKDAFAPKKK